MIHYAEYDASGKYIVKGSTWLMDRVEASNGSFIYFGEVDPLTQYHDVVINAPVALPERPSPNHRFDYAKKQWIDPRTAETEWSLVRSQRNALLSASDWTQLPDVPLATKETWAIYRQALRDITEQTDPFNINWPVQPDRKS